MLKTRNKILICCVTALINLSLFFVKIYIAVASNSISIYIDSLNSLADSFICIIAIIGFKISGIEANEKYPFGYSKIEELIDFILSVVILFTGFAFIYSSLNRFMYPVQCWFSVKYAVIISVTALVKLAMALFYKAYYNKSNSSVIKDLSVDSLLDFLISACTVVAFTLTTVLGYAVDSVMGIIASLIIIVNGIKSLISICEKIIGRQNKELCERASEILLSNAKVTNVVCCNCHSYGKKHIINAQINAGLETAQEVSALCCDLKADIKQQLNAELFITYGG